MFLRGCFVPALLAGLFRWGFGGGGSPMDESVRRASSDQAAAGSDDHIVGAEGLVKWFDPRKGFGFIVGPAGQDIFAHYSVIQGDGFRALRDGSTVEYDAERGDKGWKATRIVRTEQVEVTDVARRHHAPQDGQKQPAPPTGYTRSPRR